MTKHEFWIRLMKMNGWLRGKNNNLLYSLFAEYTILIHLAAFESWFEWMHSKSNVDWRRRCVHSSTAVPLWYTKLSTGTADTVYTQLVSSDRTKFSGTRVLNLVPSTKFRTCCFLRCGGQVGRRGRRSWRRARGVVLVGCRHGAAGGAEVEISAAIRGVWQHSQ
jgi:hypothetical protein